MISQLPSIPISKDISNQKSHKEVYVFNWSLILNDTCITNCVRQSNITCC